MLQLKNLCPPTIFIPKTVFYLFLLKMHKNTQKLLTKLV